MIIPIIQDTVDKSPSFACWVLSHDGKTASTLFLKQDGCTTESANLICATTKQECINEARRIGVVVPESVENESNQ